LIARESAGVARYLLTDHLGSPVATTNADGGNVERSFHAPFGERWGTTTPERGPGYTGHFEDATKLTYMKARYESPRIGRMLSPDPVGPDNTSGANFNRYWYANNNPIRYVDPDGRIPVDTVWDALNVVYDLGKAGVGYATGNPAMVAEGLADAALDTGAMFIPYAPAGASKVARAVGNSVEGAGGVAKGAANPKVAEALKRGQKAHKDRQYPDGFQKEVELPSGKRMDAYNREAKEVRELKPNNPRAIKRGEKQVQEYCRECDRVHGPGHKGVVETYD
jgi:RHS repeat-associated protein